MEKNVRVTVNSWAWGWGIFLLLVAALVLANQFGGFIELGIWSIIVASLAVVFLVKSIVDFSFGSLPIPIAALYYIFQAPLGLPEIALWPTLVLATLLATAGLHALIPNKWFRRKKRYARRYDRHKDKYRKKYGGRGIVEEIIVDIEDAVGEIAEDVEDVIEEAVGDAEGRYDYGDEGQVEEGGSENNPQISVQFSGVSRYLRADSLETVELDCSFGSLEVYFDDVDLSPKGAEAFVNCKFGAIEMYVPSNWLVIDNMNVSLGGMEVKGRHKRIDDNAPTIKITGNVSFGAVEVHRI